MVRVIRHKALTVDGLRARLKDFLGKPQRRECPTCSGNGHIDRPWSTAEAMEALGLSGSQWHAFMNKGKSVSLETGLRMLSWLDEQERSKLDELDDEHEPTDPDESARVRQLRAASAQAAATAAIEARNRPLQLNQAGGGRHG